MWASMVPSPNGTSVMIWFILTVWATGGVLPLNSSRMLLGLGHPLVAQEWVLRHRSCSLVDRVGRTLANLADPAPAYTRPVARKPPPKQTVVGGLPPPEFEQPVATVSEPELIRTDRYLRLLLILLVSAAFFEGYDSSILALLLPNIQSTFHVSEAVLGVTRIPIELGLFVAFFVARLSDRLGRRPLLLWSVVGYTVFTALTAFSWDIWSFAFFQFASRVFLGAEYAIGVTMIVEEFPAVRRGRALGTLLTFNALGTIAVGVLLGAGLQDGPLEWRAFYLVGLVPLLVLSFFRRRLKETRRFLEEKQRRADGQITEKVPFLEPWKPQYRRNLVLVGMVHMLRSIPLFGSDGVVGVLRRARARLHRDRGVDLHHRRLRAWAASATTCAAGPWSASGGGRRRWCTSPAASCSPSSCSRSATRRSASSP